MYIFTVCLFINISGCKVYEHVIQIHNVELLSGGGIAGMHLLGHLLVVERKLEHVMKLALMAMGMCEYILSHW